MPSRRLRIVLTAWAVVLPLLCIGALVKRDADHRELRLGVLEHLEPFTYWPYSLDGYFWGKSDSFVWAGPNNELPPKIVKPLAGSPLGISIYLLNRGYANPQLLRTLLLCEARRCNDWKYLYTGVKNYDLRSRLIERCTRDFPSDPKVHWAAGTLALAAGDYEVAEAELVKTIDLTNHGEPRIWYPNRKPVPGLRGFCQANGVSEEHFRGRYACALTLMGKWDEADEQTRLSKLAGDGRKPPRLVEDWDNVWMQQNEPEQWAQFQQETLQADEAIQRYLRTRDRRALEPFLRGREDSEPIPSDPWVDHGRFNLLRAFLLTREWNEAEKWLVNDKNDDLYYYRNSLRQNIGSLLTNLAAGRQLGETPSIRRTDKLRQLKTEYPDQTEADWSWELSDYECGSLSGLLEADYLPFLLRTDMFADALKHSGRKLDDVLAEVRAVTQPQRDNYYDYSNGALHWR